MNSNAAHHQNYFLGSQTHKPITEHTLADIDLQPQQQCKQLSVVDLKAAADFPGQPIHPARLTSVPKTNHTIPAYHI